MVAVVAIDAAMVAADNAEAVKSARSVNYFQKGGRCGDRFFVSPRLRLPRGANYLKRQHFKEGVPIMPDNPNADENIDIPPIPKETAGAVAGALVGSMMGPVGTVVGGIAGAMAGKAASERRLAPVAKKAVARVVKSAPARRLKKKAMRVKAARKKPARKATKSRKRSAPKRTKAKPRRRSTSSRGKARRRRR
jgi:hypothetical protein